MRRVARRVAVPGALTRTSSVRTAPRARDTAARALRAMRAVKVVTAPAAALARPLPIATLRPPVRMPRRRAALALTISRASMVQAAEQAPASLRPRLDIRAGRSEGRSATERVSRTEPASAWSVAVAPRESRSAPRAARVRRTLTPPVPALVHPPPSLTGRRPRRGSPSRAAVLDDTVRDVLLLQAFWQPVSAVTRPAAASAIDSSVETTAKSGGAGAPGPSTWKLIAPLRPVLPAASDWRGRPPGGAAPPPPKRSPGQPAAPR